jgi:hypothetical protein
MPPTKAEQVAEAEARAAAGINPAETAQATDTIDDGDAAAAAGAPQAAAPTDPAPAKTPPAPRVDQLRNDIVARFRAQRAEEIEAQPDEISEFTRTGMPPEFEPEAPPVEPVAEGEGEPALQREAPRMVRIKVRGEEREVPLEEAIAKAQIAYAADNYLDEAKGKLSEVDALLRETRTRGTRAPDGTPPNPNVAPPAVPATPPQPEAQPQHPEDDRFTKLVEAFQFGDPNDAAALLKNTLSALVDEASETKVQGALTASRFKDEGARTAKALSDFEAKHPEIATDGKARAAIESEMVDLQIEDIKALGIDPNQLRPDGMAPTPGDIAAAHRYYRTEGFNVRSPAALLEKATETFEDWKGIKKPQPTAATGKAAPRIEVSVDREARRAAIPQQPARTAAPRPAAADAAPQPRDRSAIVMAEMARRNLPRGKVGIM